MQRLTGVALLCILSCCAGSGDSYADRWERLSAEHYRLIATPDGAAWEREFIPVHNTFWRDVYSLCSAEAITAGVSEFRAVAVIDKTGTVTDFLTMPNNTHLGCFTGQMVGRKYPAPPVAPFYEVFEISLENG